WCSSRTARRRVIDLRLAAAGACRLAPAADGVDQTGRRPLQSCGETQPGGNEYFRPAASRAVEQRTSDALRRDRTGAATLVRAAAAVEEGGVHHTRLNHGEGDAGPRQFQPHALPEHL